MRESEWEEQRGVTFVTSPCCRLTLTERQPVCGRHLERCWAEAGMVGMSVPD